MFNDDSFMLQNETAARLYREYAADLPIVDYHCHIDPKEIWEDRQYGDLAELWLGKGGSFAGDHYKWRLMRACGVEEQYITGTADNEARFIKWAECLERSPGNPLYHWSHMELKRYFGITEPLGKHNAAEIYRLTKEQLASPALRARSIIRRSGVQLICTTDDPADDLKWHDLLRAEPDCGFTVLPAFRPDKALAIGAEGFPDYLVKLGTAADVEIRDLGSLEEALDRRMEYFAVRGCVISDHALEEVRFLPASRETLERILQKRLAGEMPSAEEADAWHTAFLLYAAGQYHRRNWALQLHLGVRRNNNRRRFASLGPDTGFDSIGKPMDPSGLMRLLDELEARGELPRTVLYSIHPSDDPVLDTVAGCFQDDTAAGKIQHGSAWWFNDHYGGIRKQLDSLASRGSLGTFIGMLTDSRSLLSYTRHDYFRRILCGMLGEWAEQELMPVYDGMPGSLIRDVSYYNAVKYFGFEKYLPAGHAGASPQG